MASSSRSGTRRSTRLSLSQSQSQLLSTSQSSSHSQSQWQSESQETEEVEINENARAMVNFLLSHSANKLPIKFSDLMHLADNKTEQSKQFQLVKKLLAERYGIKLIQLDGAPKRYICVAEEPTTSIHELTSTQRSQYTLLYIILTYIFLRGNRIEETKLYAMLETMGISVHKEHGYFGDNISKLIEDTFVKQHYLKRERSHLSSYDDPKNYYTWGLRAKSEFSYQQIVQFASKLFDQDVAFFQHQLIMAEGMDNPEVLQGLSSTAADADSI